MANRSRKNTRKNSRKNTRKNTRKQNGGKRPLNGYMKFAKKTRPEILREHPEMRSKVVDVAREIGKKWRALTPAEKARY